MNRLKTRAQFQAVLAAGTMARTPHFALHRADLPLVSGSPASGSELPLFPVCGVWVGAMVPKRWAKRAVTRNAIKRQIYNVSAQYKTVLPTSAHVVRLRSAFDRAEFVSATSSALKESVRAELLQLFGVATGEKPSPPPPLVGQ
jgi:ribonuclease P protein component